MPKVVAFVNIYEDITEISLEARFATGNLNLRNILTMEK
jgi:hypothetical protein